ncbi:hypothetical protein Tco_0333956, partial [Tanacetum coccineum]
SHFIKEIRQDKDQQKTGKKDAPVKDKAATIYMIQPWQRVTRQKVTQSLDSYRSGNWWTYGSPHVRRRRLLDGVKALGKYRRRRALYKSMDEFYDSEVTVTIQRYHWKAWDKRNPSNTIHHPRNDQVPGRWRNSDYP